MSKHKEIYVTHSHTKKVFANMKRQGKDVSGRDTPLFPTMIVQAQEQVSEEPVTDDTENVASVPTHSNDPLLSVIDLEKTKTSQAAEISELKERVKRLEKKGGSRTYRLRRLYKVGRSARVVSFKDEGMGDQQDASKQRMKIDEIDQDAKVTLVDDTHGRYGDNLMFDTGVLDNEQDMAQKEVDMAKKDISTADPVTTADEVVTIANVVVSTAEVTTNNTTTTTVNELTLSQTLIETKAVKPKARGAKDKGKAKMVEPEKPLKKKYQIMFDKEDDVQAMMDADYELSARLQAEEQGELTIKEKSRLFVELMNKRKKHFARIKVEEQRRKPPTKAQTGNTMSTYVKNVAGYKHNQLKTKSFEDLQMLFDIEMKENIDREDLETLWKLVKAKHGLTRPEEAYERVLWGDLKVMFEPDVESEVWRNLQGHKVTVWKLFSSSGVHFVRFQNLHIFMLVEKRYPLTPATITEMLNKKLQADHWNEMCYQLLKLMTKQLKNPGSV
ncbi:hypothetical protein Tco_0410510 [Tanacetum coccineum]